MNYIELINWFWTCDEVGSFKPAETRLYFYLLKVANSLGWNETFWHSDSKTAANAGFTVNTLKSARLRLKQFNLINFTSGGKGKGDKTRYQILTPKMTPYLIAKPQPNEVPNAPPKSEHTLYNEINKTKRKKKEKEPILFPDDVNLLNVFCEKFFDKKYLNEKARECFDKLIRLDGYTKFQIETAISNASSHEFWMQQFQSPCKLRTKDNSGVLYIDKFLKLKPNAGTAANRKSKGNNPPARDRSEQAIKAADNYEPAPEGHAF
jgi:hypothetical protein